MKGKWIAVAGIVLAVVMAVLFLVLEDFSGSMVLVNSRTPFFVGGAVICLAALVVFLRQKNNE